MDTKRICPNCQTPLPPDVPLGLCPQCLIKAGFNTGTEPGSESTGFIPPTVEQVARLFPQFEIIGLIGKGGMGAVYKARQSALDRFVALKILPPSTANASGFAERFNREARALARLNHPNIVAVHDFGKTDGLHYLVMEFVDGPNLRQVEQTGRLAPEQALEIIPQICEALQFAHNEGIIHRDIKPENILLDKKGRVKITDFGIAKIVGVAEGKMSLTGAKDVIGTPHYMAPEQIERPALVDHRADIFSLGVVFYEMLTGELPLGKFAAPSQKVQMDVRLDEIVMHTLEKEPERRYQHVSEVKTDVETITGDGPFIPPAVRSPYVRFFESLLEFPFTSSAAIKTLNVSALGFLGFLFNLGMIPGLHWCLGFSGFFGFFGLIGVAYLLEIIARRKATKNPQLGGGEQNPPMVRASLPWRRSRRVAMTVFALVFGGLALVTALLPRSYKATAKITVRDDKLSSVRSDGELDWALRDIIWSFRGPVLINQVAMELDLRKRWSERFHQPDLREDETRLRLRKQIRIERIPQTAMFEIDCFSMQAGEAAEIANKMAEVLCASEAGAKATIIERAEIPRNPSRPNVPLNLALGFVLGLALAGLCGAGVLLFAVLRPPRVSGSTQPSKPEAVVAIQSNWVMAARWTARIFSTLLLAFYGVFILAEGLPALASQPAGVQLNFVALGLMLLGFLIGWWREGAAALLIASGWALWHISEGRIRMNLFQTPLPVAMLYGYCWLASRGRRTGMVIPMVYALSVVLSVMAIAARLPDYFLVPIAVLCLLTVTVAWVKTVARAAEPSAGARMTTDSWIVIVAALFAAGGLLAAGLVQKTGSEQQSPRASGVAKASATAQPRDAVLTPVPPVVIETFPESGATNVDPTITEIRVTFSKPMRDGSWAWTKWGEENFPELTGQPKYLDEGRTCVLPVRLRHGKVYATWLNSDYFQDFKDREGQSAVPYLLIFETRK